jgi:hypothetical protein
MIDLFRLSIHHEQSRDLISVSKPASIDVQQLNMENAQTIYSELHKLNRSIFLPAHCYLIRRT